MMKELKDIRDDQIRIIGEDGEKKPLPRHLWIKILTVLGVAAIGILAFFLFMKKEIYRQQFTNRHCSSQSVKRCL